MFAGGPTSRADDNGQPRYRFVRRESPMVRTYTVFNAEQADGLPAAPEDSEPEWLGHQRAEQAITGVGVSVRHVVGDNAFYGLRDDEIVLPKKKQFPSRTGYYQTALHEVGHSTGHPNRLNRRSLIDGVAEGFGSASYAKEELRAEISAMMTGDRLGVGHDPQAGAAYIDSWIGILNEDTRQISRASVDAQKMSDYVVRRARLHEGEGR